MGLIQRPQSDPLLRGISAGSWKDVKQKNWMSTLAVLYLNVLFIHIHFCACSVELVNTQITFEGIEHPGFVVASSYVAQVFGCEHERSLREGDLVTKNSWMAKVQDVQVS